MRAYSAACRKKRAGWAAGLVLLCEQALQNIDLGPQALDEAGQTLFDYFAREVFARMTEPERHFMQLTSLLSEVTPQAAMRITGRDDASAVLDALCRRQLFVTRLGEKSPVYRYHDLFRAFLLGRLRGDVDAAALRDARMRAAEAMLADASLDAAIDLFIEAEAWPRAAELIVLRARTLLQEGRRETLAGFVRRLPEASRCDASLPRLLAGCRIDDRRRGYRLRAFRAFVHALRRDSRAAGDGTCRCTSGAGDPYELANADRCGAVAAASRSSALRPPPTCLPVTGSASRQRSCAARAWVPNTASTRQASLLKYRRYWRRSRLVRAKSLRTIA